MNLDKLFLPNSEYLQCDSFHLTEDKQTLQLLVTTKNVSCPCPICQQPSKQVHSRYQRTLADLPVTGYCLRLVLHVRKFFCKNTACHRQIFCERLPTVARAWGRRTERLRNTQQRIGIVAGGAPGQRLSHELAMPAVVDLLLTLARQASIADKNMLSCIGVDDWALRKGSRYGTIIIDLEASAVVDLLADRKTETLATWLQAHPTIRVVSRDRWPAYAKAIRQSLPLARQVADRWHLVKNMTDTLHKILQRENKHIGLCFNAMVAELTETETSQDEKPPAIREPTAADLRRQQRIATAKALHQQGVSQVEIANRLNVCRRTISQDLTGRTPDILIRRPRPTLLDPFRRYLEPRIAAGCLNAAQLHREIQKKRISGLNYCRA